MQGQSSDSQAGAAERLFVAVVNQAILDVLEHGKEAEEAERWLLSKNFDALQGLFNWVVRVPAQFYYEPIPFLQPSPTSDLPADRHYCLKWYPSQKQTPGYAEKPLTSAMCGETGKISAAEPASRTPIDGALKLLIGVADIWIR